MLVHNGPLFHRNYGFWCWRSIPQCTVWSLCVVVFPPFFIDGDGPMDAVREKLRQLELTKSTLKKSMEQDLQPNNIEMHPNIGQLYQRKISEISQLLSDQASREEAISLIRSLIERIDITPGEKHGQPQVQLVGGLAAIFEFAVAKQQKTAITSDSGFGRVFMVAGAEFEPANIVL